MSGFVLSCPECGTRYKTDPKSFGTRRRSVRCARCGATWDASAPMPVDTLASRPVPVPAPPEPPSGDDAPLDTAHEAEAVSPGPDAPLMRPTATVGADAMMRDRADREKLARRMRTIRIIWAAALVLVALAAIIAWFNRQAIVNRIPQMASVYRMVGVEVRAGGLDIEPPEARTVLVDGAPVIRVDSRVRNLTRSEQAVPLIELSLHDVDGQGLLQWFVETQPARIDGRGALEFRTEIVDPPDGAVSLRYRFSKDGGAPQG
ncbi:MAG: DUF3426 domain-containing protein [Pseudomonadota bacterium]